jgi:hypothetical protein
MSLLRRVESLEQRQPSESDVVRFVRFVSAAAEPSEPNAYTDHAGWWCNRNAGESAQAHRDRALNAARQRCARPVVLFECRVSDEWQALGVPQNLAGGAFSQEYSGGTP